MKLSICIPTFNRPSQLPNCLNSIYIAKKNSNLDLMYVFLTMVQTIM